MTRDDRSALQSCTRRAFGPSHSRRAKLSERRANESCLGRRRYIRGPGLARLTTLPCDRAGEQRCIGRPPRRLTTDLPQTSKATKALVSVSAMTTSDYDQCVADLTSKGIVFERAGDLRQDGCQLSGAILLTTVPTRFGDVGVTGKPAMLCSFGRQFSSWVRDVGAPLTLAYTGQKLMQIEAGSAFACRARYDKPGAIPSEHAKGDAIDIASFVLADNRRISVKQRDFDTPMARDLVRVLRTTACAVLHHSPRTRLGFGTRGTSAFRHRHAWRHAELSHLRMMRHYRIAKGEWRSRPLFATRQLLQERHHPVHSLRRRSRGGADEP